MITKIEDMSKVEVLFRGFEETMIWSCLQGVMGEVYAADSNKPMSAMAILNDFCFLAGVPQKELVLFKPKECTKDFMIMVGENEEWGTVIEKAYKERVKKVLRYATQKERGVFEQEKLEKIVQSLSGEYELKEMDEALYHRCKEIDFCKDWMIPYETYDIYKEKGLGFVLVKDDEIVAGASSYSRYEKGIEIQIDTLEPYRRKGLAAVCGARLILECLSRGLYPSWDAQNEGSLRLAEKLGYKYSHTYTAYEISEYNGK